LAAIAELVSVVAKQSAEKTARDEWFIYRFQHGRQE
jgi:hypothetical protein